MSTSRSHLLTAVAGLAIGAILCAQGRGPVELATVWPQVIAAVRRTLGK